MEIKVYRIEQVVEMLEPLNIRVGTIYRAIRAGELKATKIGRKYLISEENLNKWLGQ